MMRDIIFRGKRTGSGEWVEGDLLCGGWDYETAIRIKTSEVAYEIAAVDPSTVGQYTGLVDKNGKKIFEGDIVRELTLYFIHKRHFEKGSSLDKDYEKYRETAAKKLVKYETEDVGSCGCCFDSFVGAGFKADEIDLTCCEVIGNICDNPELLEERNAEN